MDKMILVSMRLDALKLAKEVRLMLLQKDTVVADTDIVKTAQVFFDFLKGESNE